ncbi:MAG: cell division protein ZapA, partial [Myxococcales bacterium]|nr:cell division protein ZapA [Myxococcales bacterium]
MSSPRLRPVKVAIAGQTLALRTDAPAAYVEQLATFVTSRLAEVHDRHYADASRRVVSTQALALLCAMQLADELHQALASERALRAEVRARTERILGHLETLDPTAPDGDGDGDGNGGDRDARAPTPGRRRARR